MSFSTGTYTVASGMVTTIITDFKTKIDAHPAWTWVETYTLAGRTWEVFRCLASVSGYPQDFFVYLGRDPTTPSLLYWMLSEGWNTATKKMLRPVCYLPGISVTLDPDGGVLPSAMEWDWNSYLAPAGSTPSPFSPVIGKVPVATTVQDYMLLVTDTTIVFVIRSHPPVYLGGFQTLLKTPSDDPLPLVFSTDPLGEGYFDSNYAAYPYLTTRHPKRGGLLTKAAAQHGQPRMFALGPAQSFSIGASSDLFQDGATWAEPLLLTVYAGGAGGTAATYGYVRGQYKYLRWAQVTSTTCDWLDALVISGRTYVYAGGATNYWLDQAA